MELTKRTIKIDNTSMIAIPHAKSRRGVESKSNNKNDKMMTQVDHTKMKKNLLMTVLCPQHKVNGLQEVIALVKDNNGIMKDEKQNKELRILQTLLEGGGKHITSEYNYVLSEATNEQLKDTIMTFERVRKSCSWEELGLVVKHAGSLTEHVADALFESKGSIGKKVGEILATWVEKDEDSKWFRQKLLELEESLTDDEAWESSSDKENVPPATSVKKEKLSKRKTLKKKNQQNPNRGKGTE